MKIAAIVLLLGGCAPMNCRVASDLKTRREIEICEKRECRDTATRQFVKCPVEMK